MHLGLESPIKNSQIYMYIFHYLAIEKYKTLIDLIPIMIKLKNLDRKMKILLWNPLIENLNLSLYNPML